MNKILAVWKRLVENDRFLKIISLVIALVVWIIIINVAAPVNEKTFFRIPVNVNYTDSVPERNGLMMLTTDDSLYVGITVSGQRSRLIGLKEDEITASLNFDNILSEGVHQVPISVSVKGSGVTVTDISPSRVFVIQFAEVLQRDIPVELVYTGSYPDGYKEVSHRLSPETIRISGPRDTVESIQTVRIELDPSGKESSYESTLPIRILDSKGEAVDRKYLTIDTTQVLANIELTYEKELPLTFRLVNGFGGNETYASATLSQTSVILRGNAKTIRGLSSIDLGEIHLENLKNGSQVSLNLPTWEGVEYTNAPEDGKITLTVRFSDTAIRSITLTKDLLNARNLLPDGLMFRSGCVIRIRTDASAHITAADLTLSATEAEDGKYRLQISLTDGTPYGILGEYYVSVS